MAVTQTHPIALRPDLIGRTHERNGFLSLLLLYYGLLPVSDIVSGALTTFTNIIWFAIAYKAGAVFLMIVFLVSGRLSTAYAAFGVSITALLILGAGVRQSLGLGGGSEDMLYIARGPILLNSTLIILLSLQKKSAERLARVYFTSTWLSTFLSVIISDRLGISLTSYGAADYGSKGFYQAANEVTLTFVLSWWYLQIRWANSLLKSLVLFLGTLYLIYTLGTKSGFVAIPILGLWYVARFMGVNRFISLALFLVVALTVVQFADVIYLAILPYLKAADASAFFINTYGVNSTLTGGRFAELDSIIDLLKTFSLTELMFGIGFSNFWFEIAGKSVESDLIDTLGGGGIIFAGWFYGLLLWGYKSSKARLWNGVTIDSPWAFVFIAIILYSIFVGHVAFAATPLVTVGMFLMLTYKEQAHESRHRSLMV